MNVRCHLVTIASLVLASSLAEPVTLAEESSTLPRVIASRRVWDRAPHNGFADLVVFRGEIVAALREGQSDVRGGVLRIIASRDAQTWESRALLTASDVDLRAPRLNVTPTSHLHLLAAAALPPSAPARHQTVAWSSTDGRRWSASSPIGEPNFWIWDVDWRGESAYGIGYPTAGQDFARLYESTNGRRFRPLVKQLLPGQHPSESALLFLADGSAACLARRSAETGTTLVGRSPPPYTDWGWSDSGQRLGGANMIQLPDGRIVVATHIFRAGVLTALCWLDLQGGRLEEFLRLPFAGNAGSIGLLRHRNLLWVAYSSEHEGKPGLYLAEVEL